MLASCRPLVMVSGVLPFFLLCPIDGRSEEPVPDSATVDGNYSNLLRKIKVPLDEKRNGKVCDFGFYPATSYFEHQDLPHGYWVYVAPYWYIWEKSKKPAPAPPTVDGPESSTLVHKLDGYVVTNDSGDITAIALPSLKKHVVRQVKWDGDFGPTIHTISGPDDKGRIAYVEDYFFVKDNKDRRHLLKTVNIDGTKDTEIFSRPGDAMWAGNGEIGKYLALAPTGGKIAFLSGFVNKQMPLALLHEGRIEIWDIEKRLRCPASVKAIDQLMCWFPDGKRLAYVALTRRDALPHPAFGLEEFGTYGGRSWDEVPAVYVLDIESGNSSFLHVGWTPIVAAEGNTLLIGGWNKRSEYSFNQLVLESRETKPVKWPGNAGLAVAIPAENIVLYWGLPTAGTKINYTTNNSSLVGPKLVLTLKIAILDSNQFQTVVPEIDPRSAVSFGRVTHK